MPNLVNTSAEISPRRKLPRYETHYHDPAQECDRLQKAVEAARTNPTEKSVETMCVISRQILYGLDDLKFKLGGDDSEPAYLSRLHEAADILAQASALKKLFPNTLSAAVHTYFGNIAGRHAVAVARLQGQPEPE
jgi:hypothetical protein